MRTRALPVVGVLLAVALLAGVVVAVVADSRGVSIPELLDPPPPEACTVDDPTTSGCLTPTARAVYDRTLETFGEPGLDAPIHAATCWSEHAWNPGSDHPAGRACDFFPTRSGTFPQDAELASGWAVANWLRDNASDLNVRYVIWQGRIWYRGTGDDDGWGRAYNGGGVYDPADATGGHFDHVHVSVRR